MKKSQQEKSQTVLITLVDIPEHVDREEIDSDYIRELASSIQELGLLNPILIRPVGDRFELVAGHRRLLAHKTLGKMEIPCIIKILNDAETLLARAVENLQRVDLTIIEEAKVYQQMHEKLGMSIDDIARKLGKSPGIVRRKLSLLKLLPILQESIHKGLIIYSVAEELQSIGDPGKIAYYLGYCIDHGVTLPVVRQWVQEEKGKQRQAQLEQQAEAGQVVIPRSMPVYVPCDLCTGPMAIGDEAVIRCCKECVKRLNAVLKEGGQ